MMGFLAGAIKAGATPSPEDDYWYQSPTMGTTGALSVMEIPMVYACVRVLAETMAQVPLGVYEDLGIDGKRKATDHPVYDVIHSRPNAWQTSVEWRNMMMGQLVLRGNAYNYIMPGRRGAVDQLIPLNPDRMTKIDQLPDRRLRYHYNDSTKGNIVYLQEEIFHLRGMSADGIKGINLVELARSTFDLHLNLTNHAEKFFKNRARPGGLIEHPAYFKTNEDKEGFRKDWRRFAAGDAGETAVLEHGMHWTQLGMTQEDAQYLQTIEQVDVNLARLFRMPLHMVQDLRRATFSNIEQQSMDFVMYTMTPWYVLWEQAMNRDLILSPRFFTRFNMNGLLRGTTKERYEAYSIAIMAGMLAPEEARVLEDWNPEPRVGTLLRPMNMAPVEASTRADAVLLQACAREVRREVATLRAAAEGSQDSAAFLAKAGDFYKSQLGRLQENLAAKQDATENFCHVSLQKLIMGGTMGAINGTLNDWEANKAGQMARFFQLSKKGDGDE